jgi:hypothetical protein
VRLPPESNAAFLAWAAELLDLDPDPRRVRLRRWAGADTIRCHPELLDRLDTITTGLPRVQVAYLDGLPVLLHPTMTAFGVAAGTRWLALRIPPNAHGAVQRSGFGARGLGGDWIDVDPWLSDAATPIGTHRVRGWCATAYIRAGEQAPTAAARERSVRSERDR